MNALIVLPKCPTHGGPMAFRLAQTQEQRFCGAWYECTESGCRCASLIPSIELMVFLSRQRRAETAL